LLGRDLLERLGRYSLGHPFGLGERDLFGLGLLQLFQIFLFVLTRPVAFDCVDFPELFLEVQFLDFLPHGKQVGALSLLLG